MAQDDPVDPGGAPASETRGPSWIDRINEFRLLDYMEKWRQRIRTHPVTGLPLSPARAFDGADSMSIERLAFSTGRGLQLALTLFTPISLALFAFSFLWDYETIIRSCSVAGLIGFGTNWIAIQMLFRPREIRPVFGQGLIPAQRDEIIRKVADEVLEKLINERIIKQEIDESKLISRLTQETSLEVRRLVRDPEFIRDTKRLILTYAAQFARNEAFREDVVREVERRVERATGRSFTNWIVSGLRGVWREPVVKIVNAELDALPETLDRLVGEIDGALDHVPKFLEQRADKIDAAITRIVMALIRELDVRAVVLKQLSTVTAEQLEVGFREFADDKLSYITLLGGILGALGGFLIIWPLASMLVFVVLAALLTVADIVAYGFLKKRKAPGTATTSPPAPPDLPPLP
jgi:hypothetical protein